MRTMPKKLVSKISRACSIETDQQIDMAGVRNDLLDTFFYRLVVTDIKGDHFAVIDIAGCLGAAGTEYLPTAGGKGSSGFPANTGGNPGD